MEKEKIKSVIMECGVPDSKGYVYPVDVMKRMVEEFNKKNWKTKLYMEENKVIMDADISEIKSITKRLQIVFSMAHIIGKKKTTIWMKMGDHPEVFFPDDIMMHVRFGSKAGRGLICCICNRGWRSHGILRNHENYNVNSALICSGQHITERSYVFLTEETKE